MKQDYEEMVTFWPWCHTVLALPCTHCDFRPIIYLAGFLRISWCCSWDNVSEKAPPCAPHTRTKYVHLSTLSIQLELFLGCWDPEHSRCWGGVLILSTFVLVNRGSSGTSWPLLGPFCLCSRPQTRLLPGVSGARPATLGQGRAWSKTGLQLSISVALPSLPHPHPP